ncbi:MAG: class I SAM-dependent methyltransferase [Ignavibacteriaceae bacterium]
MLQKVNISGKIALIIGSGCESIAVQLPKNFTDVFIILNDYNSLMLSRTELNNDEKIKCKMMDYANTDFEKEYFDLIYAQASLSVPERKEILKEIKRILRKDGIFCTGEIVSLKEPVASFVKDIWERSGMEPLPSSGIKKYFEGKGFEVINEIDLSSTLKDFYEKLRYKVSKATKQEKEENKKYYTAIKHESDVYLKLGGDKYIGFISFIMRKAN